VFTAGQVLRAQVLIAKTSRLAEAMGSVLLAEEADIVQAFTTATIYLMVVTTRINVSPAEPVHLAQLMLIAKIKQNVIS